MKWPAAMLPFDNCLRDMTPGQAKIQRTNYQQSGSLPIIDQGQKEIAGYTDDATKAYEGPLPVILFGDHTLIFKYVNKPFALGADGVRVLAAKPPFVPKFIFYYLSSARIVSRGYSRHFKFLRELKFPHIAESEQDRIVELLEQADGLRRQRAEADQLADRILPTLFYKMFGDPATNSKNWPKQTLGSAGAAVRYGLGQPPQSSDSGLPLIRATNIHRGLITSEDMIYVKREDVPESRNAFLKAEEVIVVRSGAYTGDIAQVTARWAGSVAGYDLVVSPGEKFTGEFLESYLLTPLIQRNYFGNIKARAGQPHLNADQLLNTPTILPPKKPLQENFSGFVNALRSQRVQRTDSEKRLNKIFATMLHRAFTGELTAKWREAHLKELILEMEAQARYLKEVTA
jgi:type I restriction enzyme S subunit